ncbi:MAG TPA: exodeoxyribonuclease III [Hyphomicrobiales bacterium]|nr:exodeoxyribonuclease III [Hyphomicrobiales bacterium]
MPLTVVTWNINSVRLRLEQVMRVLDEVRPDLIALQETKCIEAAFPSAAFHEHGYVHGAVTCQKGYHGVATYSRLPLARVERFRFGGKDDARHVAVTLGEGAAAGVTLHNFYVPAGGDIPDPAVNEKFAHKLAFLDELKAWSGATPPSRSILVGDLNVAPLDCDVWSHRQLLDVVSHTPAETERMQAILAAGGWCDTTRRHRPPPEPVFTWWSYRNRDWKASNRGRRLDHIWVSGDLAERSGPVEVKQATRDWERPSDHVPVILRLDP